MSKYDKIKSEYDALGNFERQQYELASKGMTEIAEDSRQTADVYSNASTILADIDAKFAETTKLDGTDIKFLMLATALQIGRWLILAEISKALDKKMDAARVEHNDKSILEVEKEKRKEFQAKFDKRFGGEHLKSVGHRDWANIVFDSVPYDITRGSPAFGVNMQGGLHRIHTLGHDPVLGWLFGTMNILSDTITLDQTYACQTYNVEMINKPKRWTSKSSLAEAFSKALDSIREDKIRLPAGVFAQALHLKSDEYTKLGLPVPVLEAFAPDFAGNLYENGYDTLCLMKDIAVYGIQAVVAVLINMLITLIHGLYYDPAKHQSRELYEVKTRKILDYSNLIASSSNVITVAGMSIAAFYTQNAKLGKKAMSTVDVGGIIVTMYRLITDAKFINQVKEEFLEKEWHNAVVGEDYQFVAEVEKMSKKDIQKGIAIQAKAEAAKAAKLADGMEAHAKVLGSIRDTQAQVRNSVGVILQDKADQEAERLYGLKTSKKLSDLCRTEQRVLGAALYTLMAGCQNISELQRKFYQCVEQYGISERVDDFDFGTLKRIDSYSERRIILKTICAFLFLSGCNSEFKDNIEYRWLADFTSAEDVENVCSEIEREFSVLGSEGFLLGYIAPPEHLTIQAPEADESEEYIEDEIGDEFDFGPLYEIIGKHTANEAAFGKQVRPKQALLDKEIVKDYPALSPSAAVAASKVSNGYLLFTTYAMYLRTGNLLHGEYVCLPYAKIQTSRISTADGKVKGTRKLFIPYLSDEGNTVTVELDDTKVEEEKLRELLIEINDSGCMVALTDKQIQFVEMDKALLTDYLSILASILHQDEQSLTEVYLLAHEYGLVGEWENIVDFIPTDEVYAHIDDFINSVPYPSELSITAEGMKLCLRTLCRTNLLDGNEATLLSQLEESCAKRFDMMGTMSNADFSILLKQCSKDVRKVTLDDLEKLKAALPEEMSFRESIASDIDKLIDGLQKEEEAKQNTPTAKFMRAVQDNAVPAAVEMAKKAEKQIKQIKFSRKKAPMNMLPDGYQLLTKKLPASLNLPKKHIAFGMRTSSASALLVFFEVDEQSAMPFDDVQAIIADLHEGMSNSEGIIEVNSGTTSGGCKYVYNIRKLREEDENGLSVGVDYNLNLNILIDNKIYFINGSFREEGLTGVRDTTIYELYRREHPDLESPLVGWCCDPYENEYQQGFLMNISESAVYDEQFPDHPLSETRKYIAYIVENN